MTLSAWLKETVRTWREIVTVFCAAGRGLAAAHAAGLIHRDFKPANVLVGNDGRVRVMDFGLARADGEQEDDDPDSQIQMTSHDLLSEDVTVTGTLMGTPLYMSPEAHRGQLPGESGDQFSFCVGLFTALYRRAPFDTEIPPDKPERWQIRELHNNVPRWIADIVRKGLAKEPDQRHRSMAVLIDALERDPRRKRLAIAGAVGALAIAAAAVGAHSLRRHRAIAECEAEGASIEDVWNAPRATQIAAAFAATKLSYAAETWQQARGQLDKYATSWQHSRVDVCKRSTVDSSLSPKLARAARSCLNEEREQFAELLRQLETADNPTVERAAAASASLPQTSTCTDESRLLHQPELPTSPGELATIGMLRKQLAAARAASSIGRDAQAVSYATAVITGAKAIGWDPLVLDGDLVAGAAQASLGQYQPARKLLEDAYFAAGAKGRDDFGISAATRLASTLGQAHQPEAADMWLRIAQMIADRAGNHDDLYAARLEATRGDVAVNRGDSAQAQPAYQRAIELEKRLLGDTSPEVAQLVDALGRTYMAAGNLAKAIELGEQALAIRERVFGPSHPRVAESFGNLAISYGHAGQFDKQFEYEKHALELREKLLPPDHLEIALNLRNLAHTYGLHGDFKKSVELAERAYAIYLKKLGPDSTEVGTALRTLSLAYDSLGEHEKSAETGERALVIQERALGKDHPDVALLCNQLAGTYYSLDKHQRALELATRARDIYKLHRGADNFMTAVAESSMAAEQNALHDYKTAEAGAAHSLAILEKTFGPNHPGLTENLVILGDSKMGLGKATEAVPLYERALSLSLPMVIPPDVYAQTQFRLAKALWESNGDRARAKDLAAKSETVLADGKHDKEHAEVTAWLAAHK
jgi:serine/threonine-protein kinase